MVDLYLEVADQVEDDIDVLEADVFARQAHGRIQRIYQLKRELVEFKRAVVPLQRPLMTLTVAGQPATCRKEIRRYFRDVQDHLSRTVEQVDSYDDLLNSILQARLAQVTVDQNNDMRKIAAWAGIAAVLDRHRRHLRHELRRTCRSCTGRTAIRSCWPLMLGVVAGALPLVPPQRLALTARLTGSAGRDAGDGRRSPALDALPLTVSGGRWCGPCPCPAPW